MGLKKTQPQQITTTFTMFIGQRSDRAVIAILNLQRQFFLKYVCGTASKDHIIN